MRKSVLCIVLLVGASVGLAAEPRTDRLGDPLPEGAVARLGTLRFRHGLQQVWTLAQSADGKLLATGGDAGRIRVWETASGRPVLSLTHLTGTAPVNATVQLLSTGVVIGTTTADGSGNYSVQPTNPLVDATYTLSTRIVDVAGNIGPLSAILTLRILATPPGLPFSTATT